MRSVNDVAQMFISFYNESKEKLISINRYVLENDERFADIQKNLKINEVKWKEPYNLELFTIQQMEMTKADCYGLYALLNANTYFELIQG